MTIMTNPQEVADKTLHARQPTESERTELERMIQQEVGRVAMRAQMILLSARDFTVPDIDGIQEISDVSVYKWIERFDNEGSVVLYDRPRSGWATRSRRKRSRNL